MVKCTPYRSLFSDHDVERVRGLSDKIVAAVGNDLIIDIQAVENEPVVLNDGTRIRVRGESKCRFRDDFKRHIRCCRSVVDAAGQVPGTNVSVLGVEGPCDKNPPFP